ncbi:30S ribosomal protein S8e [Candidatus Nanohalovita haloferacivicina]|uniref:30S ribosomal protein S8e n=1 Tax=Candidatus Nanohalovita haloferacivicina TaxID=2978046 RepID=UPI00325FC483|nr:Ribosomal protein S8E [Candidatus Nanohalobia archaeon BNXNv]
MAVWHKRSMTKKTGGKTRRYRKSRKYDLGSEFSEPEVGDQRIRVIRTRGGNNKSRVKRSETVNLAVDGEVKKAEIEQVLENPANPNFVRRSLLTKGTIVDTSEGKAKITSRPGQNGVVNAVPVEE